MHGERREAIVGNRIEHEHCADQQIPLVAPLIAVHEIGDNEQHDAVIGEIQTAHAGEAGHDLDDEARPVHRARQRIAPVKMPRRPEHEKSAERQRQTKLRRQRHRGQVFEERAGIHRSNDLLLRHAHEARQQKDDECVVNQKDAVRQRAGSARRPNQGFIPRH